MEFEPAEKKRDDVPESDAYDSDEHTLDEKDAGEFLSFGPEGSEYADFLSLFHDHHEESSDDVDSGNNDNKTDDDGNRLLLKLNPGEEISVHFICRTSVVGISEAFGKRRSQSGEAVEIVNHYVKTGDHGAHRKKALSIL